MRTLLALHVRDSRPHDARYQELLDELNRAVIRATTDAGWTTTLLATATADRQSLTQRATDADAVLILGGEDVTPHLYGGRSTYPGSGRHETRSDQNLIAVIRHCVAERIPLLGVCRGHQLLNVALGGTLIEHMHGHRARNQNPYVSTRVLAEAAPDLLRGAEAKCTHHQAVRELGAGLRVIARADDGVIEAIAHESAPALGVQWHPEHPDVADVQLVSLLERVVRLGTIAR